LVRLLDDDELSAVIAHELGHLAHAQNEPLQRFALGGARTDDERRADSVGIILLLTSGIPPESLAHALEKVRGAPQTPADLQRAMANRIALLPQ
jgi:predicted Zn-dependent protease